ncbi:MAG TPA: hypothetical protein VJB99_04720 [Patescibacteria group bacterium]|nr:hypothetical protein [Patescibacteria group bacterium]
MFQTFGYISALLSIAMVIPYVRDILRRRSRPERASWFIWTVLGFIAFFSQLAKGATHSLWLTAGQTIAVLVVVVLSIKYGVGGFTKRDIRALITAGVGLLLWYFTNEATYALFIVIVIDSIGSLLTFIKSYQKPESETLSTWFMSGTSGVFGVLAVGSMSPTLLAYPLYIVIANYLIVAAILLGRRKRPAASHM